jgi:hypothetical protein
MPVHLTAVKCPKCGRPITGIPGDRVFLCECGTLHTRDDEGKRPLSFDIAAHNARNPPPEVVIYIPFWRLDSDVRIHYQRSKGGFFHKLFGKDWKGGKVAIFVPAVDWQPSIYKEWASKITSNPPRYQRVQDFGPYQRMPLTIEEGEAKKLADFLILTFEAEKPGVLQEISYEVKVERATILYLPFNRTGGNLRPMF